MAERESLYQLRFESEELGGTQRVIVSLGEYEVGRYFPGTRYSEFAIAEMQKVFALALGDLVRPLLTGQGIREDDEALL